MGGSNKIARHDAVLCHADIQRLPGTPLKQFAAKYGISDATVRRIALGSHPHVAGKGAARIMNTRPALCENDCALVLGLFWMNVSISSIHRRTQIGLTTIHRILDGVHRYNDRAIR